MPALISLPASSSGVASLRLDDPLDGPELAADDPAELGRVGGEDARERDRGVVLATRLEDRRRGRRRSPAGRRPTGRGSRPPSAGTTASAAATASPVPRGDVLEREHGAIGEGIDDRRDRRREDDDRAAAGRASRRCSPRRRATYASIGRPHSGWRTLGTPSASACRDRPPARRRPCRTSRRDLGGSRGAAPSGPGRRAVVAPDPIGARREGFRSHQGSGHRRGGSSGVSTEAGDDLDLDPGPLRQRGDADRRAGRRRIGDEPAVDRVDRREVGHVDEEDRGLDDVAPGDSRPRRGRR